jgi:hypothetical protein
LERVVSLILNLEKSGHLTFASTGTGDSAGTGREEN